MNLTRRDLFTLGAGGVAMCVGVAAATTTVKRRLILYGRDGPVTIGQYQVKNYAEGEIIKW